MHPRRCPHCASTGFLTARYDCTWPPPAEDDGREVRAPQDAWTNERKTAPPLNVSDFVAPPARFMEGAEAYLIEVWRQSFTNFVRVKAQLTGPRSVRGWVTVPDVPAGYDQRSRAAATPGELVSRYLTVARSTEGDIPGELRISEGGQPLPPRSTSLEDDTTTWKP